MRGAGAWSALLVASAAFCQTPDVHSIIERSAGANEADFKAQSLYTYLETDRSDDSPAKTFEVVMILGTPYNRLVAMNGRPLSAEQQKKEADKMRQAIAKRQHETPDERQARLAKYRKERDEERIMLNEMAAAFDYKLLGEAKVGGFDTWVLDASPRPGYRPPNMKAKVLTGMRGKLWIDRQDYHWVKVEAEVVTPVYFEGFLARVGPGTRFELAKAPVAPGVWLPTHFSMNVNAKILGLFSHNSEEEETYTDYRLSSGTAVAAR